MKNLFLLTLGGLCILLGLTSCQCSFSIGKDKLNISNITAPIKPIGTSAYEVSLSFDVNGFEQKEEDEKFKIHLTQDLETRDPKGNLIEKLTRKNFKQFNQTLDAKTDQPVVFTNTLTIPISYGVGTYTAVLTVTDQNNNKTTNATAKFTLDAFK